MTTRVLRKVITIDEEKCNGCGDCVPSCAEGAIQIIDGKARLVSETYCDGLGACLNKCPMDALTIMERPVEEFSQEAVDLHLKHEEEPAAPLPCGCPSTAVRQFGNAGAQQVPSAGGEAFPAAPSRLTNWPLQLFLVPPFAPFLQKADLVLAADCAAFAYASFHEGLLRGKALVIACPKQNGYDYTQKLTQILRAADLKSLTVVRMEVPCCYGLVQWMNDAVKASGKNVPVRNVTLGIQGDVLAEVA